MKFTLWSEDRCCKRGLEEASETFWKQFWLGTLLNLRAEVPFPPATHNRPPPSSGHICAVIKTNKYFALERKFYLSVCACVCGGGGLLLKELSHARERVAGFVTRRTGGCHHHPPHHHYCADVPGSARLAALDACAHTARSSGKGANPNAEWLLKWHPGRACAWMCAHNLLQTSDKVKEREGAGAAACQGFLGVSEISAALLLLSWSLRDAPLPCCSEFLCARLSAVKVGCSLLSFSFASY